ncbi:MAG: branched-chain amino acid ABC transporter permease [Thermoleophilia bacterium]|nr:branched-chain amino acid ABC transporter permease [Thermoleophilia bacterium]
MGSLVQVLTNGILLGSMYGIAAIGLSLIFGTMRIIFIAQGTMIVLFAYLVYWSFQKAGIDPYLSLLTVVPLAFVLGLGLFYLLFRKAAALEDRNVSLLLAVGLMYLIDNLILKAWSATPRGLNISYSSAMIVVWGLRVSWLRLALLGLALASAFVVYAFLKKTRVGTAVRAASEDMEATTIQGINSVWVSAISFAIGIALAGVAGVGMATVYSFDYQFGFVFAIKALVALALGGIGNVFGALAGGLLLGIIENLAAYYVGIAWIEIASYGVFMLVLIFLPQGLFGRRALVKKV